MIELRVLAVVGLLTVMVGMTLLIGAAMVVAERLGLGMLLTQVLDADKGAEDSPGCHGIQEICSTIRITGGEIR